MNQFNHNFPHSHFPFNSPLIHYYQLAAEINNTGLRPPERPEWHRKNMVRVGFFFLFQIRLRALLFSICQSNHHWGERQANQPSKQQISILIGKLAFYSPIFHFAHHPLHHLHFELARNLLDTNHRNPIARFTLFEYATAFAGQKATIQTFAIATSTRCVCSVLRRRSLLSYTAKATPVFTFIVAACDFVNRNSRASGGTIPTAKLNYS